MSTASERAKTDAERDIEARLANGHWVRRNGVQVWMPNPAPETKQPEVKPSDLIACPVCLARMDERCKKADGQDRRRTHSERLVKRVCSCGASVRPREPMCGFCRAEAAIEVAA